jgi:hypothetical protein
VNTSLNTTSLPNLEIIMKYLFRTLIVCLLMYSFTHSDKSQAAACDGKEYRQFDFWIGEWTVMGGPKGDQLQGQNRIERSADGCRIIEHWRGAGGTDGMSLNAYDAAHQQWHQLWVGGDGLVLHLRGGMQDGSMLMQGSLRMGKSKQQLQRIRWTPKPDGSVIQLWETSDDNGKHWAISFRGVYTKTLHTSK